MKMKSKSLTRFLLPTAVAALLVVAFGGWITLAGGDGYKVKKRNVIVIDDEERGAWLGVQLAEETDHPEGGARVLHVIPDSPADRAGLKDGDIIVGVDGSVVRGPMRLTEEVHERETGDEMTIDVIRDGVRTSLDVELGQRPERVEVEWSDDVPLGEDFHEQMREMKDHLEHMKFAIPDAPKMLKHLSFGHDRPRLGVELTGTTPELREDKGGSREAGVLVAKVLQGTPAEAAGIRVGDLIVAVDGEKVADHGDLLDALNGVDSGIVSIEVIRDRRSRPRDDAASRGLTGTAHRSPRLEST